MACAALPAYGMLSSILAETRVLTRTFCHSLDNNKQSSLITYNPQKHASRAQTIFKWAFSSRRIPYSLLTNEQKINHFLNINEENEHALVWIKEDVIAGILIYERFMKDTHYIDYLAVDANLQDKGIGSAMLTEFEKISTEKGMKAIQLSPAPTAIRFYKKNNYVCDNPRCDTMSKALAHSATKYYV